MNNKYEEPLSPVRVDRAIEWLRDFEGIVYFPEIAEREAQNALTVIRALLKEREWVKVADDLPEHGKIVALLFSTGAVRLGFQTIDPNLAPKFYFQPVSGNQWALQPIAWADCIPEYDKYPEPTDE